MGNLNAKVLLITGASSDIGAETVCLAVENDYRICLQWDRSRN